MPQTSHIRYYGNIRGRKVPQLGAVFWIIKLMTTAMGESVSDYFVHTFNPYIVVISGFIVFAACMALQFKVRRYIPWVYWLAVTMVAVFGTMAADVAHVALGIPYIVSAAVFAVTLVAMFMLWYNVERTLSIHSIDVPRREMFYWVSVLVAFSLGTAVGDLSAYTFGLGFFHSAILFSIVLLLPALAYRLFKLNGVLAFWLAYIMTRPVGASFADWTGKSKSLGGLGWGDGPVAAVLGCGIILLVIYLTITHRDKANT
jgi:uncharacterized membrane-anchored protein